MNYNFYFYFIKKKKSEEYCISKLFRTKNKKFKKNDNEIGSFLFNKKK